MDPFMLHPVALKMAVLPQGGFSNDSSLCLWLLPVLSDINQATPSEQFMNDFNNPNKEVLI